MSIVKNLESVRKNLAECCAAAGRKPDEVLLVAVTKTRSVYEINEIVCAGVTDIGENKVQEILDKFQDVLSVRWHMIGHLQRNKVKYIIDKVCMIHSVDSLKLAEEIDRRAEQHGIIMDILIQVNAAGEESKSGVAPDGTEKLIMAILKSCRNIRIRGLMHIAPVSENPEDVAVYFSQVKALYDLCGKIDHERLNFRYLSMGMSGDYPVAVAEGSNLVRVGTAIFGARMAAV
ncbi:MAG: YggS family pyridoxal phosphate-dependent enzyme [Clostridiales Family XIII bacterium]|jgi:pyridoxal phosphate enzyme (YggS family)|nr:YggS family pyridoxal phosphate-dependent enzyme [Clostridiales Family XIII bacterium]